MHRFFLILSFFSVAPVFAATGASALGSGLGDIKGMLLNVAFELCKQLIPLFVSVYGGIYLLKYLLGKGLDYKMQRQGYEVYKPPKRQYVTIGKRHYRLRDDKPPV